MISLQNIGFHFGGNYLYKDVNWQIYDGQRIGLVGPNGAGKSTLLKVIAGTLTPSEGTLNKSKDCTIGFLNQELLSLHYDVSIFDVAMTAFDDVIALEEKLNALYLELENDSSQELLDKLGSLQLEFEARDGYNIKHKTEEVLEGLGFTTSDLQRPFMEFSGGWRMRVLLAKILLKKPRLLLLDEPTNHLDLPSIEWLETYLQSYEGAVIVVSHDRYFLDRMINITAEIAAQKMYLYTGNYSFYLKAKVERDDLQQRQYENQQQFIKQQERFIERFKAKATKATQAQSRMKMLEKLERVEAVESTDQTMKLDFKIKFQSGKVVKELVQVSKSYGSQGILQNSNAFIERGDRIALIGANGKGKTTLLRMIAGMESFQGTINTGHNVLESFYAQHQLEALNLQNDLITEIDSLGTGKTEKEIRTILGCFLFSGDDVFKKIKVLSGGEKARVALAKCLALESNFLLLDEPTNHLDMQSIDILVNALQNFQGTVILVSHDRHFIEKVATKIWWIQNQELKEYPGTYAEFKHYAHHLSLQEKSHNTQNTSSKNTKKIQSPTAQDSMAKSLQKEKQNLEKQMKVLEQQLEEAQSRKGQIEMWLSDPNNHQNPDQLAHKNQEYQQLTLSIHNLETDYETCFNQLLTF